MYRYASQLFPLISVSGPNMLVRQSRSTWEFRETLEGSCKSMVYRSV